MDIKRLVKTAVLLYLGVVGNLSAQISSAESHKMWHSVYNEAISDDGQWVYYTKAFENEDLAGVLVNTKNRKQTVVENPAEFTLTNNYFIIRQTNGDLLLKDLNEKSVQVFNGITQFAFDIASQALLLQQGNLLHLIRPKTKREVTLNDVKSFQYIDNTSSTLVSAATGVQLLNNKTGTITDLEADEVLDYIVVPQTGQLKMLLKSAEGLMIVTFDNKNFKISSEPQLVIIPPGAVTSFANEKVIMTAKPFATGHPDTDTIQVWSGQDAALRPKLMNMYQHGQVLTLYNRDEDIRAAKTYNNVNTEHFLVFDGKYILEYDELANYTYQINDMTQRPQIRLRNRETDLVEWKLDQVLSIYPSKHLNYLLYFKNKDWYFYDVFTGRETKITAGSTQQFHVYNRLNTLPFPVDSPVFSPDYRTIYLTSRSDIWKYTVENGQFEKITSYSDKNIAFRLIEPLDIEGVQRMKWVNNPTTSHDYLLLHMIDTATELREGLAVLRQSLLTIIEAPNIQSVTFPKKSSNAVSYVLQSADRSPGLFCYNISSHKKKDLKTNLQLPAGFPETKLVSWTAGNGNQTYATVILPPGYSPERQYPAIVRIYENEAKRIRNFTYPTYFNGSGFNSTLYALEGYVVIMPKIFYKRDDVGDSVVESLEESLRKVLSEYSVDPARIGLIGHSFGGYETNYVLTKSSMFRAAVSGSGIADIVSDYFTFHKMYLNSNMSRYTNEQFSFSSGFFDRKEAFLKNNPILNADLITTPLLLWTGDQDTHVEVRQSVEMFMALSSLKKEVHLMLFPGDPHLLLNPENQKEATKRFLKWFDYHLKDGQKPAWF